MKKRFATFFTLVIACIIITACRSDTTFQPPFTDIAWNCSVEQLIEIEGTSYQTATVSAYGGDTYIYNKEYLGIDGQVKYMTDEQGQVVSMAWCYIGTDESQRDAYYIQIQESLQTELGNNSVNESELLYDTDTWNVKEGTVILLTFTQNHEYALQVTFIPSEKA